jgi:tetratricopeptide (TPR) repeat protein
VTSLGDIIEAELRDRYTLERELGEGGMARVWIATDVRHHRPVALKVLRPELALSGVADRFLREVRVLAELQHPHILALLDSGLLPVAPGGERLCPYYVMPLVRGETLRDRLSREGQLPLETATAITTQVAAALDYAHKHGVVHRDVKPENLLLADDQVYLADFGIASALESAVGSRLTETGLALGTPAYMSPEQASAERRIDGRSDQYGLACVVYEMLAGEPPFSGPTAQAIIAKRLSGPAPSIGVLRPSLPACVAAAMARALAQASADRFPTAGAFAAALHTPAPGTPTSSMPAARTGIRWTALLVTALLLILAGAFGWRSRGAATKAPGRMRDATTIQFYDRAQRLYEQRTQASSAEAVRLYFQAIARDSGYAQAWSGLATTYVRAYGRGFTIPGTPSESLLTRALHASDRAFVADSGLASTWVARAVVMRQLTPSSRVDMFRAVHRALAIDSASAEAWSAYALALGETDSLVQAAEAAQRALGVRPTYVDALTTLALVHFWRERFDSAAVWADSALALEPTYVLARFAAGYIALARGDAARAEREFAASEHLGGGAEHVGALAGLAQARVATGDPGGARRILLGADSAASRGQAVPMHSAVYLAEGWAALGGHERAVDWLERFERRQDLHFQLHLRHDAAMKPLRADPRFEALLAPPPR